MSRRNHERERGGILPLVAICLPVLLLMTSFAIDLGIQRASRRTMQARADVIALDMARLLGSLTANQLRTDPATETAIQASANRNSIARAKVINVDWGTVDSANAFHSATTLVATAVKVTTSETTDRLFHSGSGSATRSAIATASGIATFGIGTKLATLDTTQAALLNGLMNRVLGSNLNLSAATYNGLAGSTVNIGSLSSQLGFASPTQLAGATVNAKQFYLAEATVLQAQGNTAAANVMNLIAAQTNATLSLPVSKLMQIDAGGGSGLAAGFDAFNLLQGSLYAINGSSAISIPNMSLGVPGLTTTTITLNVIEGPRFKTGPVGTYIDTHQASISVTPTISALNVLGTSVTGTIPLTESVAGARGTLTAINCGTTKGITIGVNPQPVTVTSGLNLTIRLLGIPIASTAINASAAPNGTSAGGGFLYTSEFMPPVGPATMRPAPTTSLGLAGLLSVDNAEVTVLGVLPVTLTALTTGLNNALSPILAALDTAITGPVAHALGLEIGGSDLGAVDMTCSNPLLVG